MSKGVTETAELDVAAKILARIITMLPAEERDTDFMTSAVFDALMWLRNHDHPGLWLNAHIRDLMEAVANAE